MNAKASGRYAKSLLDLAREQNQTEAVKADMDIVIKICAESHELELLLQSPIIKVDQKYKALTSIFEKGLTEMSLKFIQLITRKRRERLLPEIASAFVELYKKEKGIVTAHVTSAVALSDAERKSVAEALKGIGKEVEVVQHIDAALIGGLKVRVGDRRFDASIQKKLNELKQDISK